MGLVVIFEKLEGFFAKYPQLAWIDMRPIRRAMRALPFQ
jgi:hypothetical protein